MIGSLYAHFVGFWSKSDFMGVKFAIIGRVR